MADTPARTPEKAPAQTPAAAPGPDRLALLGAIADKAQELIRDSVQRRLRREPGYELPDLKAARGAFKALAWRWLRHPEPLVRGELGLALDVAELVIHHLRRFWLTPEGAAPPPPFALPLALDDKRFKDEAWAQGQLTEFLRQLYLLVSRHTLSSVAATRGLDPQVARQVNFYTRQVVSALSPSNFLFTNPQVLRATLDSGGFNLLHGTLHLLEDLVQNRGRLMPRMTDQSAFTPGVNVATTPGKVVFQTELMQLIQYAPLTPQVHRRPLLIIPPWINKFYILDLKPKNSLIRWAVEQGHTVFVISWVNPDERLRHKAFEDYLREGTLAALDAIATATGETSVNAVGYCIGGTLLGATLGYLAAEQDPRYPRSRIASATFFATLLDFSEVGEMAVFIDEEQVAALEKTMERTGYLDGGQMAGTFNALRENDLLWSFVVSNYLLGREPAPFDLLYWNSDSTRMPATMHSFYLRNMYLHNRLREPGGITLCGAPIDLGRVDTPAYFVATREDHIAVWRGTYQGARLLSGPVRFVLGGSGHIAGIVNPPAQNKYGYATGPGDHLPATAAEWLAASEAHEGSWWLDWARWLQPAQGEDVPARVPGAGALPALMDAPGSYVRVKN